jgi:replicative DNA helicase
LKPPSNKELEKSLIGCLLQDKKIIPMVESNGGSNLFYTELHIQTYAAIKKQADSGEVDIMTVAGRVEVARSYLLECLTMAPTVLLAESYTKSLKELYIKRELLKLCHNTAYNIEAPDILEQAETGIREIGKQIAKVKHIDLTNLAADLWEAYLDGKKPDYMKTGIVDLDRIIDGIEHTEHIIIGARPGQGKTALACDIARNVAKQGKKITFFTMEMDKKALVRRFVCAEAGVSIKRYKNRTLDSEGEKRVSRVLSKFDDWNLQIIDGRVTVSEIKAKVLQDEPDLVVVDYLQLMSLDRRGGVTTNDLVGDNVIGLQGIAKSGPAVITLSQLSRASEKEKRKPGLGDLYESGKIEAAGDKIIAPYREDKESTEAEILVLKQKDGPVGKCDVEFVPEFVTFRSIESRQEPPAVMAGSRQWGN